MNDERGSEQRPKVCIDLCPGEKLPGHGERPASMDAAALFLCLLFLSHAPLPHSFISHYWPAILFIAAITAIMMMTSNVSSTCNVLLQSLSLPHPHHVLFLPSPHPPSHYSSPITMIANTSLFHLPLLKEACIKIQRSFCAAGSSRIV